VAVLKISKRKQVLVGIEVVKKENWADVKSQLGAEPLIWVTKAGWGDEGMKAGDSFEAEPDDAAWLLNHYGLARSGPTCPSGVCNSSQIRLIIRTAPARQTHKPCRSTAALPCR